MPATSATRERNAELRTLLTTTYPDVKFHVRNGRNHRAHITWTDGPTREHVDHLIRHSVTPWLVHLDRDYTTTFICAAMLHAQHTGRSWCTERTHTDKLTNTTRTLNGVSYVWHDFDADQLTNTLRDQAAALQTIAGTPPPHVRGDGDLALWLAQQVRDHASILTTILV